MHFALEPLARGQAKPVVGIPKLDRELGRKTRFGVLFGLIDGFFDLCDALVWLDRVVGHPFVGDAAWTDS